MVSLWFKDKVKHLMPRVEDRFETPGIIGEGTYGVVFKARKIEATKSDSQTWYALKGMKSAASQTPDGMSIAATREIALLRDLKHENIVEVQEMFVSYERPEVWFLFEYAEYDLWSIIAHYRESGRKKSTSSGQSLALPPPESLQKSMMYQILQGMNYLHSNWILHRDLKPANILVMGHGPDYGVVKIGDLGMARVFYSPLKVLSEVDPVVVTFWYRSPELLLGAKHYTKAIDMWAVGCIMAELITTKPVFWAQRDNKTKDPYHKDQLSAIFNITGLPKNVKAPARADTDWQELELLPNYKRFKDDFKAFKPSNGSLDKYLKIYDQKMSHSKAFLISQLLKMDPVARISAQQALQSTYFNEEPLPTQNVFAGLDVNFPVREFVKDKDEKNTMKCSIAVFQKKRDETTPFDAALDPPGKKSAMDDDEMV